jgi:hypothetical protein
MTRPEVTGWLSKMPDQVAMWLLAAVMSLLVGAIGSAIAVHTRVSVVESKIDSLGKRFENVESALGIARRDDDEGDRVAGR